IAIAIWESGTDAMFRHFAQAVSAAVGRSYAFFIACAIIVAWAVTGPLFHYSDTWQLVINTGTTIVTFLMVFLIQNTQDRDNRAVPAEDVAIHLLEGVGAGVMDVEVVGGVVVDAEAEDAAGDERLDVGADVAAAVEGGGVERLQPRRQLLEARGGRLDERLDLRLRGGVGLGGRTGRARRQRRTRRRGVPGARLDGEAADRGAARVGLHRRDVAR